MKSQHKFKRGYTAVIVLGIITAGTVGAVVYDKISGGKLSNAIRENFSALFNFSDDSGLTDSADSTFPPRVPDRDKKVDVPDWGTAHGQRSEEYTRVTTDYDFEEYEDLARQCHKSAILKLHWNNLDLAGEGIYLQRTLLDSRQVANCLADDYTIKNHSYGGICEPITEQLHSYISYVFNSPLYKETGFDLAADRVKITCDDSDVYSMKIDFEYIPREDDYFSEFDMNHCYVGLMLPGAIGNPGDFPNEFYPSIINDTDGDAESKYQSYGSYGQNRNLCSVSFPVIDNPHDFVIGDLFELDKYPENK